MPENDAYIASMTGVHMVRLMAELAGLPAEHALERAHEAFFYVGLGEVRYRAIGTYSLGMKQAAKLAQAIVHGPKLLFLDEPTNGLDPPARARMIQLIQEILDRGDLHLILSSHLLRDVEECCDQVLILKDGNIAAFCNLEEERKANRRFLELETRGEHNGDFLAAVQQLGCETAPGAQGRIKLDHARWPRGAPVIRDRRRPERADPPSQPETRFPGRYLPESHGGRRWPSIRRPTGPTTANLLPGWSRFMVIPRYAFAELRSSRLLSTFFIASFIYPLISILIIYVQHNVSALSLLGVQGARGLISINVTFFMSLLGWQSVMALFLAAFVGPAQISPDLANNALSLYLARPFSRLEYVLGKMSVLVILMSLMTWIPGLLCFGLQGYLEGGQWMQDNLRLATGTFFGAWIWILILSLLALALSAWVKWKPAAGGLMFGVFFVSAAFGAVINAVQRTRWGNLFNVSHLVGVVWVQLFEGNNHTTTGAVFFRVLPGEELPLWTLHRRARLLMPHLPLYAGA